MYLGFCVSSIYNILCVFYMVFVIFRVFLKSFYRGYIKTAARSGEDQAAVLTDLILTSLKMPY